MYRIRPAKEHDAGEIVRLTQEANMGTLSSTGTSLVAEEDGLILGFIRITNIDDQAYVNPIVVAPAAQKRGVGRALMHAAHAENGELRFVARGGAISFYETLGCERISWDDIAKDIANDCPTCKDLEACSPVPMRYR